MTTLLPRSYGGFPTYQFTSPNQMTNHYNSSDRYYTNRYYPDQYSRAGTYFPFHYPPQPIYQPPFNPYEAFTRMDFSRTRKPAIQDQITSFFNKLDERYRYEQYSRRLGKLEKQYAKFQNDYLPWTANARKPDQLYTDTPVIYQYEKETKFVPYPVALGSQGGFSGNTNMAYETGGVMGLPPKIRVIFIPTGQSTLQQPSTGPLTMPPFLYGRISQPLCSFPLPPPLPQLGSLPLTPAVQQMVVQRYSNPVAVLPFNFNRQIPQLMMPSFQQVSLYQQQSMIPMRNVQPVSAVPLSNMNPAIQALPSCLPAPQYLNPLLAPTQCLPAFSSVLQPNTLSPQSYFPSPSMPTNLNVSLPPPLQQQWTNSNAVQTTPQYFKGDYPSICRACPPAPPPLNISVTGHCWVQHCAACHHVPISTTNPNARPSGGRITPLLRHPTVPQYVPEQTIAQQQQYYQATAPVLMRPWLRKTPPLPPGAILISDEYINKKDYFNYDNTQRLSRLNKHDSRHKNRSSTVTSKSTSITSPTIIKDTRSVSPRRANKSNENLNHQQGPIKSNSMISKGSSDTSSSGLSFEYRKVTTFSTKKNNKVIPKQLATEARNVNLKYNYQPQELPSVYLINRYLKSGSEASTSSPNPRTVSDSSPSLVKDHSQTSLMSNNIASVTEQSSIQKENEILIPPSSQLKQPKEKVLIIREFISSSPSTISTVSSNIEFCIINQEKDSNSTKKLSKLAEAAKNEMLEEEEF